MRAFVRVVKGILTGIIVIFFLILVWQMAERIIFKQEMPSLAGYSQLAVLSGSMEPEISAGDLIIIHRQDSYETGDVITFSDEEFYTTHRIIGIEDNKFCTKGDANNVADRSLVELSQVAGRVILVIPAAGRILLFLRTPLGFVCLLLSGLLVLFLTDGSRQEGKRCGKDEKTSD